MRGILGLSVGGEMAPSMSLRMTWRSIVSRGFEVSGDKDSCERFCGLYDAVSIEVGKYRVQSVILRVSSEVNEDVEVSDNDDKDRSRDFVNCMLLLSVFDKVSTVFGACSYVSQVRFKRCQSERQRRQRSFQRFCGLRCVFSSV
jgi:hypothetical protein